MRIKKKNQQTKNKNTMKVKKKIVAKNRRKKRCNKVNENFKVFFILLITIIFASCYIMIFEFFFVPLPLFY